MLYFYFRNISPERDGIEGYYACPNSEHEAFIKRVKVWAKEYSVSSYILRPCEPSEFIKPGDAIYWSIDSGFDYVSNPEEFVKEQLIIELAEI